MRSKSPSGTSSSGSKATAARTAGIASPCSIRVHKNSRAKGSLNGPLRSASRDRCSADRPQRGRGSSWAQGAMATAQKTAITLRGSVEIVTEFFGYSVNRCARPRARADAFAAAPRCLPSRRRALRRRASGRWLAARVRVRTARARAEPRRMAQSHAARAALCRRHPNPRRPHPTPHAHARRAAQHPVPARHLPAGDLQEGEQVRPHHARHHRRGPLRLPRAGPFAALQCAADARARRTPRAAHRARSRARARCAAAAGPSVVG